MATVFHADDFGITEEQARRILALGDACGGMGAISSISIFANSPAFEASAEAARPFVSAGALRIGVHVNLVEGPAASPLHKRGRKGGLADARGMLALDFVSLLKTSLSTLPERRELYREVYDECRAQIALFCSAFPEERGRLRIDSHQHVHMIPLVYDAMMHAAASCGCTVAELRIPFEAALPHLGGAGGIGRLASANGVKDALLGLLSLRARRHVPQGCRVPAFCGVVLSGRMHEADVRLIGRMEDIAARRGRDLEVLLHPVSMRRADCLDPAKTAFADACCAPGRDAEAAFAAAWRIDASGRAKPRA